MGGCAVILSTYKDPATFRVVDNCTNYAIVHPGYPIPHGFHWLADCATFEDAQAFADDRMESDALLATIR